MTAICFGCAAVLLALAVAVMTNQLHANPSFSLVAAAAVMALAGFLSKQLQTAHRDLLEQRKTQNALLQTQLAEQKRAVDDLADGLEVAVFICDAKGNIQYANRYASAMFKLASPSGRTILAATLSYELERLVSSAAATGQPDRAELSFTYPEERVGLAKAWCPQRNEGRVFLSIIDITDLRRLERVRQDFVANVSHELRTPMTLIRAMAETLLDDVEDVGSLPHRYLSKTISEVDRLSSITQDLLVLSAAESNPVRKQICDIAELFQGVVNELEPQATAKGLTVQYIGKAHCLVEANTAQMKQVALNLVENAVKYTVEGSVTVTLDAADPVVIRIEDTGFGIPSEHLGRIFERFYRVDKGRSRATGGTGLGLSIVKHIVEAHGGTVTVDSSLNQGSTFTVRLPVGHVQNRSTFGE